MAVPLNHMTVYLSYYSPFESCYDSPFESCYDSPFDSLHASPVSLHRVM